MGAIHKAATHNELRLLFFFENISLFQDLVPILAVFQGFGTGKGIKNSSGVSFALESLRLHRRPNRLRIVRKRNHPSEFLDHLAAGFPIATGDIEKACRHLVKNRLERSGMKWIVKGTQYYADDPFHHGVKFLE